MRVLRKLVLDDFEGVIEYSVSDTKVIVYSHDYYSACVCKGVTTLKVLELRIIQHVEDLSLTFVGTNVIWLGMEV